MMSLRSWLALLVFYVLYLLMGGYIFNAIECPGELAAKEREAAERSDVRMLVLNLTGEWSSHVGSPVKGEIFLYGQPTVLLLT